jgi:hypothetical protein
MKFIKVVVTKFFVILAALTFNASVINGAARPRWEDQLSPDSTLFLRQLKAIVSQIGSQLDPSSLEQQDFKSDLAQKFIDNILKFKTETESIAIEKCETKDFVLLDAVILENFEIYRKEVLERLLNYYKDQFPGDYESIMPDEEVKYTKLNYEQGIGMTRASMINNLFDPEISNPNVFAERFRGTYNKRLMFANPDVISDISKNFKNLTEYKSNPKILNNASVSIEIPQNSDKNNMPFLKDMLTRSIIAAKVSSLLKTLDDGTFRALNINFFNSKIKKYFPLNDINPVFSAKNINSAEYYKEILTIFREEECLKTIIHETLHRINIDQFAEEINFIQEKFALQKPESTELKSPNFAESLVEGMAAILNVIITAQELSPEAEAFSQTFNHMWTWEKTWGIFQSAKMLYLSGFKSFDEFLKPGETKNRVMETTSAAEYHILKAALIYNPDPLFDVILKGGQRGGEDLKIIQPELQKLLLENCNNPEFKSKVDAFLNWFWKNKPEDDLVRTGRMTLIEKLF